MDLLERKRLHAIPGIGREVLATLAGIVLALTPLALWIAWSPQVMGLVLAAAAVAAVLVVACWPDRAPQRHVGYGE
ncbi:MAG: hypothetical protein AMJ64_07520 [Betaproteobacteria bacterium SG8_39]|nr:MAG: hypothetical protein AMJ64_07520 [Betaproteobacteria bacterium SG8_39]